MSCVCWAAVYLRFDIRFLLTYIYSDFNYPDASDPGNNNVDDFTGS